MPQPILKHTAMRNGGVTLIELLVVVGILILIFAAVVEFQVEIFQSGGTASESLTRNQDARSILRIMVRELRSAKTSSNGAYPIAEAATSSVTFYSDADGDGLQERIRYFIASSTLMKGTLHPAGNPLSYNPAQETFSILANNITATSTDLFEYFGQVTGTSTALVQPVNVADIRLIRMHVVVGHAYTSAVTLRNLKSDL